MSITIDGITSHIGLVVSKRESTYDHGYDSNYYAIVWDWDTMSTKEVHYYNTHPGSDLKGDAQIDPSPDVASAYDTYRRINTYQYEIQQLRKFTNDVLQNSMIRVYRGRKLPIGLIGTVTKIYTNDQYNRCLILGQDGKTYETYIKNLEVIYVPLQNVGPKPQYDTELIRKYSSRFSKLVR